MHSSVDYRAVKQLMNEMQHSQMVKSLFQCSQEPICDAVKKQECSCHLWQNGKF